MNYYIEGDPANADRIKAAFKDIGIETLDYSFNSKNRLYFTFDGKVCFFYTNNELCDVIKTHQDYQKLALPIIEPKFKIGDTIQNEAGTYEIIGINYGEYRYLVNGGSISFFVQDTYKIVENECQTWWLREAREFLYKNLYTRYNGNEHYVASYRNITQTELVDDFINHMKAVMKGGGQ